MPPESYVLCCFDVTYRFSCKLLTSYQGFLQSDEKLLNPGQYRFLAAVLINWDVLHSLVFIYLFISWKLWDCVVLYHFMLRNIQCTEIIYSFHVIMYWCGSDELPDFIALSFISINDTWFFGPIQNSYIILRLCI